MSWCFSGNKVLLRAGEAGQGPNEGCGGKQFNHDILKQNLVGLMLKSVILQRNMNRLCCISCVIFGFIMFSIHNAQGIALDGSVRTWPDGNVYYNFSNNVSAVEQKAFLDAATEWAMFANLHFIPRTNQTNYITVAEMPPANGEGGGVFRRNGWRPAIYNDHPRRLVTICDLP